LSRLCYVWTLPCLDSALSGLCSVWTLLSLAYCGRSDVWSPLCLAFLVWPPFRLDSPPSGLRRLDSALSRLRLPGLCSVWTRLCLDSTLYDFCSVGPRHCLVSVLAGLCNVWPQRCRISALSDFSSVGSPHCLDSALSGLSIV
jgi:hypothetical protein